MHTCNRIQGELVNNHLSEKELWTPPCMQDAFDVIWQSCILPHSAVGPSDQCDEGHGFDSHQGQGVLFLCLAGVI